MTSTDNKESLQAMRHLINIVVKYSGKVCIHKCKSLFILFMRAFPRHQLLYCDICLLALLAFYLSHELNTHVLMVNKHNG